MGTKMAPSYACLFMGFLEQQLLDDCVDKPFMWVRFIDDIFGIWTHGKEKWETFYEKLNSSHASIKFEGTLSETGLPFLDVDVRLNNGIISTDLYTKSTDSHNYLPWSSCHPRSTKTSIPYSQALRIRRICSEESDFNRRLYQLEGYLRSCNYPSKCIKLAFAAVRSLTRASTLEYRSKETNCRITFPITFHPNLRNLPLTLHGKYNTILLRDSSNKKIFSTPPMVAYRRPPNLRDLITRASITSRPSIDLHGFYNCSNTQCKMHPYNTTGNTFTSSVTKKVYRITQALDCTNHNIIYLVTCTKPNCQQQYVGETGRRHTDRSDEHVRGINNFGHEPVPLHFTLPHHTLAHFSIQVIEHCRKSSTPYRKARERYWQKLLKPQINLHHCENNKHTKRSSQSKHRATYRIKVKNKRFSGK